MNLNRLIDHTNLKIDATQDEIAQLVKEAKDYNFNSICIRPDWLKKFGAQYKCSAVISFPRETYSIESEEDKNALKKIMGNFSLEEKSKETIECLKAGALELDPVINLSKLEELEDELAVYRDRVLESSAESVFLKPIFSCEILSAEELELSIAKYSEFVAKNPNDKIKYCYKNSTGFIKSDTPGLLNTTSQALIKDIVSYLDKYDKANLITIKAAGGIRTKDEIQQYYDLCHGRLSHIGTSSSVKIFCLT